MLLALTAQLAVPVNKTPTSATLNGTITSGTTETQDAVLGTYQCQLIAGRRYLATMNGLTGLTSVAGDIYLLNIRNSGSASTPTSASTLVAQSQWTSTTSSGPSRIAVPLAGSFIAPTTGLNTFAFFAQRASGTGTFTPVSPNSGGFPRELFVMYLGAV
jgi:hypothetical protein